MKSACVVQRQIDGLQGEKQRRIVKGSHAKLNHSQGSHKKVDELSKTYIKSIVELTWIEKERRYYNINGLSGIT